MTDPLVERLDELIDGQTALVGVTDDRLGALVEAFSGTQRISGRDGRDGRNGRNGRAGADGENGHNAVVFVDRSYFMRRQAFDSDDGKRRIYVGHAYRGTDERARGWYIERTSLADTGLVVVSTGQSGMVSWSERAAAEYAPNPVKTATMRALMHDTPTLLQVIEEAAASGSLSDNDARAIHRILTTRADEFARAVEGWSAA